MPKRPAIAAKCTIPLVDPPIDCNTVNALRKASFVITLSGVGPFSFAILTAWAPVCSAWRKRSARTAGMHAPPGNIMPNASPTIAMVLAVPITPQVPADGTNWSVICAISSASISPARYLPQNRRQSVQAPKRSPLCDPGNIGPVTSNIAGTPADAAPMRRAGTVLSQPPIRTTESIGCARTISSVSIDIRLRIYMLVGKANDSWMVMVGNSTGNPPANIMPRLIDSISCGTVPWQAL